VNGAHILWPNGNTYHDLPYCLIIRKIVEETIDKRR
jgi:hypothetical protein